LSNPFPADPVDHSLDAGPDEFRPRIEDTVTDQLVNDGPSSSEILVTSCMGTF
jgi:hypothetical protein